MKQSTPDHTLLAPLRSLPLPVELGRVERMVAAFPAATGLAAWLARIRTNFNSILIMTISVATILTAALLLTGGPSPKPIAAVAVPATADTAQVVQPASTTEVEAEQGTAIPPIDLPAPQAAPTDTTLANESHGLEPTVDARTSVPVRPLVQALEPPAMGTDGVSKAKHEGAARTFPITGFTQLAIGSAPHVNPDGVRKRGKEKTTTNHKGSPTLLVQVEEGPFSVSAAGDEPLLDLVQASVVKGKAYLYWDENANFPKGSLRDTVRIRVALPRLGSVAVLGQQQVLIGELHGSKELELSAVGSGSIKLARALALEKLLVLQSGSGAVHCPELDVQDALTLSQLGSGSIVAAGHTGSLVITQSGSGSVVGQGLSIGQDANLSQVGGGLVALTGTAEALSITQSGSGRITCEGSGPWGKVKLGHVGSGRTTLAGEATDLIITLSGSGSVDASGLAVPTANVSLLGSGSVKVDKAGTVSTTVTGSGSIRTRHGVQGQAR